MTGTEFEAALRQVVAPRLERLGYQYDEQFRVDDELFGFNAWMMDGRQTVIQFQRRQLIAGDEFTINLIGRQGRAARLSTVLWFVLQSRRYPTFDYWWRARDAQELRDALLDAVEAIEQYGIPWLEDGDAPLPWEMPVQHNGEFIYAVQDIVLPVLQLLEYEWQCQSLSGEVPYCYFSRRLPDGTFALIEMQTIYSLDPDEFYFDVRLQRRGNVDPLSFSGDYEQWRSTSLAQLAWQAHATRAFEDLSVADVKALFWHYHDRVELDAQLRDALEQIQRIGLHWIEQ